MISYLIYQDNGKIIGHGLSTIEDFKYVIATNKNVLVIENPIDTYTSYIQDGSIVKIPDSPGIDYIFDYDTKDWILDIVGFKEAVTRQRDSLLANGPDRISPVWWDSMTPEKQTEWFAYRQSLLDITDQPGYPFEITWPEKPQ